MPNDFKSTDGNNKEKIDGFVQHFELRRKDHESRVVPFLHMDPESLKTNDNLIRVWKSQDPNLKIYGQPVDTLARQAVNEIMSELYTNRSR